ncbi:MAG TPA: DUF4186 domain-containing protein [Tepidisphaeraceae bacterium]|jgi:hypothetical protein|nr:DUF4186 domain-containing protein [Tepidisphaeraceae bacterium]
MRNQTELFEALKRSPFRAKFRLGSREQKYVRDKGPDDVIAHAHRFIRERLAPAQPFNDGKQTPWRGHPVFVAQHATATCCRSCLKKWHHIDKDRELTSAEQDYVVAVIMAWINSQSPSPANESQPGLFQ